MLEHFGQKVRSLREAREITREEFCGDESELSVRQLSRIENGGTAPSLLKVNYIAIRLGMTIGDLTDGHNWELPKRYKEIKYTLLYVPTYRDEERIAIREALFDEIMEDYYDQLPEEEKLAIECLQATMDVMVTRTIDFGTGLLEEYLEQIKLKRIYRINDLVLLRLYILCYARQEDLGSEEREFIQFIFMKLLSGSTEEYDMEESVMAASILSLFFELSLAKKEYARLGEVLEKIKTFTEKAQDFHRLPINNLFEWKYALFCLEDTGRAEECYQKALLFAKMTADTYLEENLKREWENDRKKE